MQLVDPVAPPEMLVGLVSRDPEHPRAEGPRRVEGVKPVERRDEGFLEDVFVAAVVGIPLVEKTKDPPSVAADDLPRRGLASLGGAPREVEVSGVVHGHGQTRGKRFETTAGRPGRQAFARSPRTRSSFAGPHPAVRPCGVGAVPCASPPPCCRGSSWWSLRRAPFPGWSPASSFAALLNQRLQFLRGESPVLDRLIHRPSSSSSSMVIRASNSGSARNHRADRRRRGRPDTSRETGAWKP